MTERIVVAVDGGPASQSALEWVLIRARSQPVTVEITSVVETSWADYALVDYRSGYQSVVDAAADRAREVLSAHDVQTTLRSGDPAHALIAASRTADLVVIGTNHTGSIAGILHGTLPLRVAGRSRCTTVVVPAGWTDSGSGVVAGWADDGTAETVVAFAAAEAERRGEELTLVHSWHVPPAIGLDITTSAFRFADLETASREQFSGVVARTRAAHPTLFVVEHLTPGSASVALVSRAQRAALVVVGSHARSALGGLILGSVSHDVLMNMPAPVAVLSHPDEPIEVLPEILDEYLI